MRRHYHSNGKILKEKNMDKQTIINIYNAMLGIETKGTSTMIMADCLRAMKTIIDTPEEENGEEE